MRRDLGRHADRDAIRTVDQQMRNTRRQNFRLRKRLVVVRLKIDRFLFDVGEHSLVSFAHANFGVAHRRRRVAVDRAEVSLPVDQRIAHRKILRQANDRVVDGGVAVRMIFTDHVADDAGRLSYKACCRYCRARASPKARGDERA